MRASILATASVAALLSLPAQADHRHYPTAHYPQTSVSFSFGYPFGYYGGFGYRPWGYGFYPYGWGPSYGIGVGVHVGSGYSTRKASTAPAGGEQRALKMYVYPAAGQTEAQTSEDRYQCHVWAADESDFDPTLGAGSREDADNYSRAFTACMEARNYVVK
jgi:hypothetical protein